MCTYTIQDLNANKHASIIPKASMALRRAYTPTVTSVSMTVDWAAIPSATINAKSPATAPTLSAEHVETKHVDVLDL
jgi:hypothetical protein